MIEAGIFDVGGVLHSDTERQVLDEIVAYLEVAEDTYLAAREEAITLFRIGKISEKEYWEKVLSNLGSSKKLPLKSLWLKGFEASFTANQDVLDIVAKLKTNGYRLAALSNTIEPHQEFLESFGLYDPFDVRIFSNQVGLLKPDPQIYQLALERLSVRPQNAFFVDDKAEFVEGAAKVGIKNGIVFQDPKSLKKQLKGLGVKI